MAVVDPGFSLSAMMGYSANKGPSRPNKGMDHGADPEERSSPRSFTQHAAQLETGVQHCPSIQTPIVRLDCVKGRTRCPQTQSSHLLPFDRQ